METQDVLSVSRYCLAGLYLLSTAAYAAYFAGRRQGSGGPTAALVLTSVLHVAYLWFASVSASRPIVYNMFEAAGVMAVALALVYLHVESRMKEKAAGVFIAGISAGLMTLSAVAGTHGGEAHSTVSSQESIVLHIAPAIVAYAGFTISFILSAMFLMQHWSIRKNRFGMVFDRFPALETLGDMNLRSIWFGVVFMALAIGAGAFFSARAFDLRNLLDWKVASVAAGWAVFLAAAVLGRLGTLSRKRIAVMSIAGFAVFLASAAVANPVLSRFHKFM